MSTLTLPSTGGFATPIFESWNGETDTGIERTEFESGVARQRRTRRRQLHRFKVKWLLDDIDAGRMRTFLEEAGGNWFNWTVVTPFYAPKRRYAVRFLPGSIQFTAAGLRKGRPLIRVTAPIEFSALPHSALPDEGPQPLVQPYTHQPA